MKYVLNKCHGGFGLSDKAFEWLIANKNWTVTTYRSNGRVVDKSAKLIENSSSNRSSLMGRYSLMSNYSDLKFRCDPDLIECIETIGPKEASGRFADLEIIDCPLPPSDDLLEIDEYDGWETLQTIPMKW